MAERDTTPPERAFRAQARARLRRARRLGFKHLRTPVGFYVLGAYPEGFADRDGAQRDADADAGVAAVPGSAFADTDTWDNYMRVCIARRTPCSTGPRNFNALSDSLIIKRLHGFKTVGAGLVLPCPLW